MNERSPAIESLAPTRLVVAYELSPDDGEDPFALAREIAVEQTVEVPEDCIPAAIDEAIVGHLEGMERLDHDRWRALVSYPQAALGDGVPQLLTLLFGNVSMKAQVRVTEVGWPGWLVESLPGPAFGIEGIRARLPAAEGRPLLCTALKPMGLDAEELARRAGAFARGGLDLVKDDHGLADQPSAPFDERVARCQEAVVRAASEAGRTCLYLPHLTGPRERLAERVETLRGLGVRGALVSPFVLGLDTLRWLAESSGLVLFAHPALSGVFTRPDHGIAAQVLYGDLLRLLGADGVIYANAGGRFPVSETLCQAINQRLRRHRDGVRRAFPVAGGGVTVDTAAHWTRRYGPDTVFLIGGSLYQQGDVEAASRRLVDAVAAAAGRSTA